MVYTKSIEMQQLIDEEDYECGDYSKGQYGFGFGLCGLECSIFRKRFELQNVIMEGDVLKIIYIF